MAKKSKISREKHLAKKQRTWARGLPLDFEIDGRLELKKQVELALRTID